MFRKSTLLAALGFSLLPAVAQADHRFDTHHDRGDRYDKHGHVNIEVRGGGYEYRPVVREERVWVEPVYRTVCDRVWVEPVTRREVYDRVWVPDRYEWRETVCWAYGRRVVRGASVLVEPGHFEDRCRDVVIVPGHYEDRPRQELIVPGHWEARCDPRPVESHARIDVRFPVRW